MTALDHAHDRCIGNWRCVDVGEDRVLRCDGCDAQYPATPENARIAIDENEVGIWIRRLAMQGATQLADERKDGRE